MMNKLKILRTYIASVLLFMITGAISGQEILNAYLLTAAENNPAIKARFNDYMASLEVIPQAKSLPDPKLAFGYFIQPVETRNGPQQFKISASQMFPWFGTLKAAENASIQAAKAKYELFEETRSGLYNSVKATYFNLYLNQKAIEITTGNIGILNTFRNLAVAKLQAGLVSSVDELRVEIEIGELDNQMALLIDNGRVLMVMFNNLLNVDNNRPIVLPEKLWEDDFPLPKEVVTDSINRMNHQLLNLDFQQESLRFRKELAEEMGKPTFNIGFDYTIVGRGENSMSGEDAFMFPNIGVTLPLYRNKYKAMVQEIIYLSTAKEMERAEKSNMLENLFEKTWKEYQDAGRRIVLYNSQLYLAMKSVKLLETEYSSGNKNFEEVLRMENMVLKFNLELERARADKQAAISFINYLMGQ